MLFIWFGLSEQTSLVSSHTDLAGILVLNGWTRTSVTSTFCVSFFVFLEGFSLRIVSEFKWSPVTSACVWTRSRQWRMEDMSGLCTHTHTVRTSSFLPVSFRRAERRGLSKKKGQKRTPTNSSVDDILKYNFKLLNVSFFTSHISRSKTRTTSQVYFGIYPVWNYKPCNERKAAFNVAI